MFFTTPNPRYFHLLIAISLLFIIINLLIIDIVLLRNDKKELEPTAVFQKEANQSLVANPIDSLSQTLEETCPNSCIVKINQTFSSMKTAQTSNAVVYEGSAVKEFFIPLGTGSNATDDWADVPGNEAYIDSTQYGQIKTVAFEAGVHIPTGNQTAYVRLFNVTDKHPVWFSDVSLDGGTPGLLISKPITLDPGNKLYKVQMKTSLKYQAILDQARVHIITY